MTKSEYRILEALIHNEICKDYPLFLTTEQAAEALGTSKNKLGTYNDHELRPIKTRRRSYKYLRPEVIKAIIRQVTEL